MNLFYLIGAGFVALGILTNSTKENKSLTIENESISVPPVEEAIIVPTVAAIDESQLNSTDNDLNTQPE